MNSINNGDILITEEQFGKKLKRDFKDYGLDPSNENDRISFLYEIDKILQNPDFIVKGKWKGQEGEILFYCKGEDLVLVRASDNSFVSIFKGGANNGWFKDMRNG